MTTVPTATTLGGIELNNYCKSSGNTGGVSLDGATAWDWHCVTRKGAHIGFNVDDACQRQYPYNQAAYSRAVSSDPYSWKCYA